MRNMDRQKRSNWKRLLLAGGVWGGLLTGATQAQQYPNLPELPATNQLQMVPQQSLPTTGVPQVPTPGNDVRLQVYNVPSGLVGQVGAELQVQFHSNPAVRVTTDPKTGQLMVMAPEAVHQAIDGQTARFHAKQSDLTR